MNLDTRIDYEYTTIYNFRPRELYGMGKESLKIVKFNSTVREFLEQLEYNSSIKFTNDLEIVINTEEILQNPEWTSWIGQPQYFIVDIKIEEIKE